MKKAEKIIPHGNTSCNYLFEPGKLTFLMDGNPGSSGKGKLESFVVEHADNFQFCLSSNSANASHIVWINGREMMFKCLPSSAYKHENLEAIYLVQGSVFEISTLFKEIEMCGIPREKIRINPKAGIITDKDIAFERGLCDLDGNPLLERGDGTIKGGSTCSGAGAVRAKKALRHKTLVYACEVPDLAGFICETEKEIMARLDSGESGLYQIGQGFPLSCGLAFNGRHSTARNVTVSAALDDAMLPPKYAGNVLLNFRTFPIKIHNYKYLSKGDIVYREFDGNVVLDKEYPKHLFTTKWDGRANKIRITTKKDVFLNGYDLKNWPDYPHDKIESHSGPEYPAGADFPQEQKEITWADVEKQYGKEIPVEIKFTSLTLLERRCFESSLQNIYDAILYNQPPAPGKVFVSMNFMNWVDGEMDDTQDKLTLQAEKWLDEFVYPAVDRFENAFLTFLGTGKETNSMIQLEE